MAQDPDAALMLAFQRGDAGAFRALYVRHARAMVAFCHRFVRDAARAEELAQDVFVKLHRSADRYTPRARFKTFLYRVATTTCLNELRRGEYAAREVAPGTIGAQEGEPDAAPVPIVIGQSNIYGYFLGDHHRFVFHLRRNCFGSISI